MCMSLRGNAFFTCVCVGEFQRCVHVYGSKRNLGVYMCMGQGGTEVCKCVWVR